MVQSSLQLCLSRLQASNMRGCVDVSDNSTFVESSRGCVVDPMGCAFRIFVNVDFAALRIAAWGDKLARLVSHNASCIWGV